jgi:hypothetical protein
VTGARRRREVSGGQELVDDVGEPAEINPAGDLDHRDPTE